MTRAMNTLILSRAHYRRRYGNDAPEMSIPSRFLEEVPNALIENLGATRAPAWANVRYGTSHGNGYNGGRRQGSTDEFESRHYNYEDESQEAPRLTGSGSGNSRTASSKPFVASWMTPKAAKPNVQSGPNAPPESQGPEGRSIDNIARFFGGKAGAPRPGSFARPKLDIPAPTGSVCLKKGERVRHSKYGEGTVLIREGDGEDAKLTVMFARHGMKKLMEKFANLEKI
jgi:DNA helicase-2/ATP-dependent DNA helicase PcrA